MLPMPTGQWTGSNVMVGFVVAQFCIVLQKMLSWEEGRRKKDSIWFQNFMLLVRVELLCNVIMQLSNIVYQGNISG